MTLQEIYTQIKPSIIDEKVEISISERFYAKTGQSVFSFECQWKGQDNEPTAWASVSNINSLEQLCQSIIQEANKYVR